MNKPFLTARWEHVILLNYAVPAGILEPRVPRGTELDTWQGVTLVSLVGFLFADTRVRGVAIPGHREFEEVNLRFYVRRRTDEAVRRAVVFIRELVPRRAVPAVARWVYNEPYLTVPMGHAISVDADSGGPAHYSWRFRGAPYALWAYVRGPAQPLTEGSEAEFVTEHHWGYTRQRDGGTLEYRVERPPWHVWTRAEARFEGPAADLYGDDFGSILAAPPRSVYVAVGSAVAVGFGRRVS